MKIKEKKKQLHTVVKTNKMNIKLDFNRQLIWIDGNPVLESKQDGSMPTEPVLMNKMIASNLSSTTTSNMKVYYWTLELFKTGTLSLDKPDLDLFKTTIQGMTLSNLVHGRISEVIQEAEKEAEKPVDKPLQKTT